MANHRLNLLVGMNPSQAVSGFKSIGASAATSMADAALGVDRLSARVQAMGLAMVAASAVGMKGLFSLAETGSALSEQQSKVNQIFGKSEKIVQRFASSADKAYGLSERAVNEAAGTFGIFFKAAGKSQDAAAQMSVQMTKLAADFASFADTSPEEAITAIAAAFRGEMEPIRKYGILLDDATLRQEALRQGLIATTSEALTPQQKTLAAYNLILAQSVDAQGNFALTSGGLANQQRQLAAQMENLRATIGQSLEPAFSSLLKIANSFVGIFNQIPKPIIAITANAALMGTALTGVAGIMTFWLGKILSTSLALRGMDKLVAILPGRLGKMVGAMNNVSKAMTMAKGAIAAFVAIQVGIDVYNDVANTAEKATKAQSEYILAVDRGKENLVDYFDSMVQANNEIVRFSNLWRNMGQELNLRGDDDPYGAAEIEDFEDAITSLLDTNPELIVPLLDQLKAEQALLPEGTRQYEDRQRVIGMLEQAYADNKVAVDAAAIAAGTLTTEEQQLEDALEEAKDALETHTDAASKMADEYDRIVGIWMSLNGQSLDLQQSYLDLNEAIWEFIGIQNGAIESDKSAEQSQIDIQKALDSTATSYVDTAVAMREANGETVTAEEKARLYKEALMDLKDRFPELADQIQPLIDTMNAIPETIDTTVEVDGKEMSMKDIQDYVVALDGIPVEKKAEILTAIRRGDYDRVVALLDELDDPIELQVTTDRVVAALQDAARRIAATFSFGTTTNSKPPIAKAVGGQVYQGETYRVGEQGPETFVPAVNGTIIPAGQTLTPVQAKALFPNFVPLASSSAAAPPTSSSADVTSEEDLMANKYEVGDISTDEYRRFLQTRMQDEERYTSSWMQKWRTLKAMDEEASRAKKEQTQQEIQDEFRKNEIMYLTGEKSAADYKAFLQDKLASYQQYSEDWYRIWSDIKRLQEEQDQAARDATKAREDEAKTAAEEAEAAVQAAYDRAEAQADLTRANDELIAAVSEADRLGGIAYQYAVDRKRTGEERAQAAADADRAYQRAAQALYEQARAQASTMHAEGTTEWAQAFHRILNSGKGGYNSQIQGYVNKLQESVPQLATGGLIRARPGGTLVNVGEGGQDEYVIPANQMGQRAGNTIIYMTVNGNNPNDVAKALETYITQTGRKPRGF